LIRAHSSQFKHSKGYAAITWRCHDIFNGRFLSRREQAQVWIRSCESSDKDAACDSLISLWSQALTIRLLTMEAGRTLSPFTIVFAPCSILVSASSFFQTILAQSHFPYGGGSYDCSLNIICLGGALVYDGSRTSGGVTAGALSLLPLSTSANYVSGIAYSRTPV
jgi:hypothetical protein